MDTSFHIYDDFLNEKDFLYFFVTNVEKSNPWDSMAIYHGFLITSDRGVIKTRVPLEVYKKIPDELKMFPNKCNRFKIDKNGSVISNIY